MIKKVREYLFASKPPKHIFPLEAPPSYYQYQATNPEYLAALCNGCGPAGWKYDIIPDQILGCYVGEACNIHDYEYHLGQTEEHRKRADENFYNNLIKICHNHGGPWYVKEWRKKRVRKYYNAVRKFGQKAFESNP